MRNMKILGTGSYLPKQVYDNSYFVNDLKLKTSEDWIKEKTGIRERHYASSEEATSDLAFEAAQRAITEANVPPEAIDLILLATTTPDRIIPSTACLVQKRLKAVNAAAVDLNNACSGYIYAMDICSAYLAAGIYKTVLVIGADTASRITDMQDRNTAIFFADGAGAAVFGVGDGKSGVLASCLKSDGAETLYIPCGGSRQRFSEKNEYFMVMDSHAIWDFATRVFPESVRVVCEQAGIRVDEVDLIIPHQANANIIKESMKTLGLPEDKAFINIYNRGNTISATVPIALDEAKVKTGDKVVFVGFGAGLAWGAILMVI